MVESLSMRRGQIRRAAPSNGCPVNKAVAKWCQRSRFDAPSGRWKRYHVAWRMIEAHGNDTGLCHEYSLRVRQAVCNCVTRPSVLRRTRRAPWIDLALRPYSNSRVGGDTTVGAPTTRRTAAGG